LSYGTPRGRWVIAAAVLGSGIASLDATVVGIALPSISRSFHVGVGSLQWVVTGYSLTLASFILVGGSLGDRMGRRRIFSIGVAWFALASAVCGLAPNAPLLILARAVQGVGGALLTPASLAIIQASFRPDDRSRAIGAWSGLGGLATAAGPLVGGYLIAIGSWRWVFFINLPVAAVVLVLSARHVPESSDPTARGRVDLAGAALAVTFLTGLTYGLIEGSYQGWTSAAVLTALIVAGLSGVAFLVVEHRIANPMLPLRMFAVRQFSATNAVTFVVYGALGGALFLLPVELQIVEGYSPLASGLSLLPITVIMLLFSARSGRLASRIGPRLQMSVGPVVVGVSMFLLTFATHGSGYITDVLPGVLVLGAGLAITVAPLTATAMASAPSEHSGIASAVNNVVARSASLIAVAVLPVAAGIAGAGALEASSLAPGFRTALVIAGATSVAGGVLAALLIRNPPPAPGPRLAPLRDYYCAVDGAPLQPS
jgi:EmrB/QacA subfamily drug resistance transporter